MSGEQPRIHPSADVQSGHIGPGTRIWQFVVVLPDARIGSDCNICAQCFVENDVVVGDRVTIKNGVQLWDGLRVGDDVFIGPNATFTNDKTPRSRKIPETFLQTIIEDGASIGAGATILPGLRIGAGAMVGSGAVVTRSVPPHAIVVGNPARIVGYVDAREVAAGGHDRAASRVDAAPVPAAADAGWQTTLHQMPRFADIRGSLTAGEFGRGIPFEAKRYFIVHGVPSVETRGEHAHRRCHQFLVCVHGSVNVVADDGRQRREYVLDRPDLGLHLPPMVWGIQYKYSADAVLLVFASDYYDPDDYIREYAEFRDAVEARA
jgi:acetyltransferase-like isoleucine patch superfamily enzyme/dTDP-4-dehydrorhamnose 3,5-epimerase-like enzyme